MFSDPCAVMKFIWVIIILLIANSDIYLKNQLEQWHSCHIFMVRILD